MQNDEKAIYKIVEKNGFWKYYAYKSVWWGWKKIVGRDRLSDCEDKLRNKILGREVYYYDANFNRIGNKP